MALSQMPALEHSISACAWFVPVAMSPQAGPKGQTLSEQSGATGVSGLSVALPQPSRQSHTLVSEVQVPCPLQLFRREQSVTESAVGRRTKGSQTSRWVLPMAVFMFACAWRTIGAVCWVVRCIR